MGIYAWYGAVNSWLRGAVGEIYLYYLDVIAIVAEFNYKLASSTECLAPTPWHSDVRTLAAANISIHPTVKWFGDRARWIDAHFDYPRELIQTGVVLSTHMEEFVMGILLSYNPTEKDDILI